MTSCTFNTPLVCAALMAAGPSDRGKTSVSIPLTRLCILASFKASRAGANGPHLQYQALLQSNVRSTDHSGASIFVIHQHVVSNGYNMPACKQT